MNKKYLRPYCENCKLIYDASAIGYILKCTKCNQPITIKSFNPWPQCIVGVGIIIVGLLTLFIREFPIIWIGGFLFGATLIFNSFEQWNKVENINQDKMKTKEKSLKEDSNYIVITCGKCSKKIRVLKGRGTVKIRCLNCSGEYRIKT